MTDQTRPALDTTLRIALSGGKIDQIHAAADAVLAFETKRGEQLWARPGSFRRFTLSKADWAAVIASSDPASFGRALWKRHRASTWADDELPLFEYLDALRCYVATGTPTAILPLRDESDLPEDIAEEIAALEVLRDGLLRRDKARAGAGIAFFEHAAASGTMRDGYDLYPLALRAMLGTPARRRRAD
ncbi:MAG: hypothetical protein RL698_1404 [Pseudomonadota bacterium]|jgi:hypothetical protein